MQSLKNLGTVLDKEAQKKIQGGVEPGCSKTVGAMCDDAALKCCSGLTCSGGECK